MGSQIIYLTAAALQFFSILLSTHSHANYNEIDSNRNIYLDLKTLTFAFFLFKFVFMQCAAVEANERDTNTIKLTRNNTVAHLQIDNGREMAVENRKNAPAKQKQEKN